MVTTIISRYPQISHKYPVHAEALSAVSISCPQFAHSLLSSSQDTHSLPTTLFRKYKPKPVVSGLLLLMLVETNTPEPLILFMMWDDLSPLSCMLYMSAIQGESTLVERKWDSAILLHMLPLFLKCYLKLQCKYILAIATARHSRFAGCRQPV